MSIYLTTVQAAEMLQANPSTLRIARSIGVLYGRTAPVCIKVGASKVLYPKKELLEWIEAPGRGAVTPPR